MSVDDDERLASFKTLWLHAPGLSALSPTGKLVAFVVGSYMDPSGKASPSLSTVARDAGLDRSTAKRRLRDIEAAGLLVVHRQGGANANGHGRGGRGKTNTYQGRLPAYLLDSFSPKQAHQLARLADKRAQQQRETGAPASINGRTHAPRSIGSTKSKAPRAQERPPADNPTDPGEQPYDPKSPWNLPGAKDRDEDKHAPEPIDEKEDAVHG